MQAKTHTKPIGKCSIYLGEDATRVLTERGADQGDNESLRTRSGTINAILDRYGYLVRSHTPTLAIGEWLLVFDALNGVWMQEQAGLSIAGLAHGIADHCHLNGADKQFRVPDCRAFVARLAAMPTVEKLAIIDAAERFWATDHYEEPTDTEALEDALSANPFAGYVPLLRRLNCPIAESASAE